MSPVAVGKAVWRSNQVTCCKSSTVCLHNFNISQDTTIYYIIKLYFWATCFDCFQSSSGPTKNKCIFYLLYRAPWDPKTLRMIFFFLKQELDFIFYPGYFCLLFVVNFAAGDEFPNFILAYFGITFLRRHCLLK